MQRLSAALLLSAAVSVFALTACTDKGRPIADRVALTATATTATFPLHVEPGKRYLVDAAGKPFMLRAESAWGLMVKLKREEVVAYLEDRRQKGFNAVLVMLIVRHIKIRTTRNAYGDAPFDVDDDFSTPNERYFSHVDWVLQTAAEKGMYVLLAPAYAGYRGTDREGWFPVMRGGGPAKLRAYGRFVANRFRNRQNILWVNGGDYTPERNEMDLVRAVAEGIRDVLPNALQTFHGGRGTAAMHYWGTEEPWLNVNDIYTNEYTVVQSARAEYARTSVPFFLIEGRYDGMDRADEWTVRAQAYQAMLGGATGQIIGKEGLWEFSPDWRAMLNTGGARSMATLGHIFATRRWWELQPDIDGTVLVDGVGVGLNRAVAARSADGSHVIAYLPSPRKVSVDLSRLSGPKIAARWIDPSDGTGQPAFFALRSPQSAVDFLPPARNASGKGDWVLLLDSAN